MRSWPVGPDVLHDGGSADFVLADPPKHLSDTELPDSMCTRAGSVISKEAPCGTVFYSRAGRRLRNLLADARGGSSIRGPTDHSH
jgi:hypothetical protein